MPFAVDDAGNRCSTPGGERAESGCTSAHGSLFVRPCSTPGGERAESGSRASRVPWKSASCAQRPEARELKAVVYLNNQQNVAQACSTPGGERAESGGRGAEVPTSATGCSTPGGERAESGTTPRRRHRARVGAQRPEARELKAAGKERRQRPLAPVLNARRRES